jgi:hypothetical protein
MKGRNGTARAHVVPITKDLRKLFDGIPHGDCGDFIFSVNGGRTPVATGGSELKATLAGEMLHVLRARAKARGEDPAKVALRPFRNHDIRRAIKSGMARLGVCDDVSWRTSVSACLVSTTRMTAFPSVAPHSNSGLTLSPD